MDKEHVDRVKNELKSAGFTSYGLLKSESRYLPRIIHDDEHIGGAVYGQIGGGTSAVLVATDKRIIFLDRKPLFSTMDEITYDVVSGIKTNRAGLGSSVSLHTRVGDYNLRFVNAKCADNFVVYIENRRIQINRGTTDTAPNDTSHTAPQPAKPIMPQFLNTDANNGLAYLGSHDIGVLSTLDRLGKIHGAVVYYVTDADNYIYILTKSETGKGRNILAHHEVALTVFEAGTLQTLQVQGIASVVTDQGIKSDVFSRVVKPRSYRGGLELPPVTKIHEGSYLVIKVDPVIISYHDYSL